MGYVMHRWWCGYAAGIEVESIHVDTQLLILCEVVHTPFDIKLIVTMNKSATHDVVEMEMGAEHMNELETFIVNVTFDGCPFCLKHTSRVDDAGFMAIVADNVAVFHQRIDMKCFYFTHTCTTFLVSK